MNLVQTTNFTLAVHAKGDPSAANIALVLPGRLETKDYAHMQSHVNYLASLGYFAVSFDPPGIWESPGAIDLYTSENYLQAIHELIAYYGNKSTLLVGHSQGGSMAMLAGVANPNVTAIVPIMASALPAEPDDDWQEAGTKNFYRDLPPGTGPTDDKKVFELPYTLFTGADNLLADLGNYHKSKLFVLGIHDQQNTADVVMPGYDASAEPKRLYKLNAGHGYRYQKSTIDELNAAIGAFVKDFNLV